VSGDDQDADLMTEGAPFCYRPARTQSFVVRVRCDYQNPLFVGAVKQHVAPASG